jgi:hypothetical protein
MSSEPVVRMTQRSPPDGPEQPKRLREQIIRGAVADVLSGEAEHVVGYPSHLTTAEKKRVRARREERADAVQKLTLDGIMWARVLVAVFALALTGLLVGATAVWISISFGPAQELTAAQLALPSGLGAIGLLVGGLAIRYGRKVWR